MDKHVAILRTDDFKFARGFKMPDDQNLVDAGKDWIKWGKDNLFPNFLNKIFYSSAYQGGIIRGKVHYLCGSGWTPKQGSAEQIDEMFGQWNCQDVLEMLFKDYELYNGFALRVLRSVEGKETFEHVDFDMLRAAKDGSGWYYSDDWSKAKQDLEETGLKFMPNYDERTPQFESVYVYLEKAKGKAIKANPKTAENVYPEPVYAGALKSLMTDVEIQSFHLFNIINGMKVAGVLNFANGEPPEKSKFESAVQDALTPTENAGGILINYSEGDDRKPTWIPLSNEDLDKRYLTLETSVVQNIMTGHGVTSPMLFGIKTSSQLGGTTELEDSFNIFTSTYVRGRQTTIESHLNYLLKTVSIQLNEPHMPKSVTETSEVKTIQETALNGAQIASLLEVINSYNNGVIDRDAAVAIISSAFPSIPTEKAEGMVPETKGNASEFHKFEQEIEDKVLLSLLKRGKKKDKYKVLSENLVDSEDFDFDATENSLRTGFMKFETRDLEAKILDLVRKGEKLDGIVEALEDEPDAIKKAYQRLLKDNLITNGEITTEGVRELAKNQPEINLEVVYSYDKRPDVTGNSVMDTTRDFCRTLVESGLVFTRQEIDQISNEVDRNVWLYRGGWYADPTKPRPTPFCRHIWKQQLVISNE